MLRVERDNSGRRAALTGKIREISADLPLDERESSKNAVYLGHPPTRYRREAIGILER
jgi:hypothetical protein